MQRLKIFYHNYITWIYTLQYIFFSMILLLLVSFIDLDIIPISRYLPNVIKLKVDFTQSILITLSAAFLTITTFTFSTILNVLNTYASSFSPRVVENFINMKITLKVIGIFIGGFFYCVGSLIFTRDFFEKEVIVAGFVAIIYSIICIMYFIVFMQRVITKFQGVNVILDITNTAQAVIDAEVKQRKETKSIESKESYGTLEILSGNSGYFSSIDLDSITSLFEEKHGYLTIERKIGEYVVEGTTIATLFVKEEVEEELPAKILSYIFLQDKKLDMSDYRYNITKLLEIALRAISPGINDPNTAIHCINKLGVLLSAFAKTDNYRLQKAENNNFRIYYSSYSFGEDLRQFYMPLINYGKTDLQVILAILDNLALLFHNATDCNKKHILELVEHLKAKVEEFLVTDLEKSIFEKHINKISG